MKRSVLLMVILFGLTSVGTRAADAKQNWDKACAKCHGADGKGNTKAGKTLHIKDLTDAKIQGGLTDERAFKAIKEGLKDGDKTKMKPAENLSDSDIKALVAHVRSFGK